MCKPELRRIRAIRNSHLNFSLLSVQSQQQKKGYTSSCMNAHSIGSSNHRLEAPDWPIDTYKRAGGNLIPTTPHDNKVT